MEQEILFKETQKFDQWWLKVLLLGINLLFLYGIYGQMFLGGLFGSNPMSNLGLILVTLLSISASILLLQVKLKTLIKADGVYFRFYPLQREFKFYPWEEILKSRVREYSPLKEFGGWGWRFSVLGKGIAYTVSGNQGLQLKLKGNKRVLIGTNKPEELKKVLQDLNKCTQ